MSSFTYLYFSNNVPYIILIMNGIFFPPYILQLYMIYIIEYMDFVDLSYIWWILNT